MKKRTNRRLTAPGADRKRTEKKLIAAIAVVFVIELILLFLLAMEYGYFQSGQKTDITELPIETPSSTPEPTPTPTPTPAPTPTPTPEPTPFALPETVYPEDKVIYLTFDDGPSEYTARLLDVLDRYNAKATFFVTNQFPDYTYLIGEEYRRGHAVGIHTSGHVYRNIYSGEEAFFNDFYSMQEIIFSQTGAYTNIYRFPGGSSNTVSRFNPGIMTRLSLALPQMGIQYFDWNVDSKDAGGAADSSTVYYNVIAGIQSEQYPVVLQHDIKGFSVNAVEDILIWGNNNGYTFLPLDVTSPAPHEEIAN